MLYSRRLYLVSVTLRLCLVGVTLRLCLVSVGRYALLLAIGYGSEVDPYFLKIRSLSEKSDPQNTLCFKLGHKHDIGYR